MESSPKRLGGSKHGFLPLSDEFEASLDFRPKREGNGLQCGTPGISHKRDDVARRARGGGGGATSRALVCVRA